MERDAMERDAGLVLIRRLSLGCSYAVWLATLLVAGYLGYSLWAYDELRFIGNGLFNQLWQQRNVSRLILWAMAAPGLGLLVLLLFWIQSLFGLFSRGHYFDARVLRCFLALVWTKAAALVYQILFTLGSGYLYRDIYGSASIELELPFSEILTVVLMLVILHLLSYARQLEQENSEFV